MVVNGGRVEAIFQTDELVLRRGTNEMPVFLSTKN